MNLQVASEVSLEKIYISLFLIEHERKGSLQVGSCKRNSTSINIY